MLISVAHEEEDYFLTVAI